MRNKKNIQDILALTSTQQGMLCHYLQNQEIDLYFEQLCLDICGQINIEHFETAWNFVVETNEMLRATFQWETVDKPVQIILKKHTLRPDYYDFSGQDPVETKRLLEEVKVNDRRKKFYLMQVPFRVTLCKIQDRKYLMVISNHHILYDGWSNGIILKEFFEAYDGLSKGKQLRKPHKTRFKEFVKWNQHPDTDMEKQEKYWENYLKGADSTRRKSIIRRKNLKGKGIAHTGNYRVKLSRDMKENLGMFLKKNKITLASLLYSAWGILLQRYNRCDDVIFATTVSGRSAKIKGIENIVGLFINTLPLRVQTKPGENISDFLVRMNHMLQTRSQYETGSPLNINEYLETCYQENLFDSVMVIENYPLDTLMTRKNSTLSVNSFSTSGMTMYDLTVIVIKLDIIEVNITYNKALFDRESISRLSNQLTGILRDFLHNPGKKVSESGTAAEEQRKQVLVHLNRTADEPREPVYQAPVNDVQIKLVEIWSQLLGVDKNSISIETNFFEFGGHSLKANLVAERIHKEMNVKLPLVEIFRSPTIKELSQIIMESSQDEFVKIEPVEKKEYYPLSPVQKRLYVLQQVDLESTAYNGPTILSLEGQVDIHRLEETLKQLINRHESLRTSFHMINKEPVQQVHDNVKFDIEHFRAERMAQSAKHRVQIAKRHAPCAMRFASTIKDFMRPFDLAKVPLLRVGLIKIQHQRHILMADMHHIITDETSLGIFRQEFIRLYRGETLPLLPIQYKDFSQWQNKKIISGEMKKQETYWLDQFKGNPPVLRLPTDFPRPKQRTFAGASLVFELHHEEAKKLRKLAKSKHVTMFIVVLAIFNVLLYKITGQDDIVVGTITAGRKHADLENIMGFFVNTLALRNFPRGDQLFCQLLEEVGEKTLEAFDNEDYQFDHLVEKVIVQRKKGRNPLFDVLFAFFSPHHQPRQNSSNSKQAPVLNADEFKVTPYQGEPGNQTKFDLVFYGLDTGDRLSFTVTYAAELFKEETVERYIEFFKLIVSTVKDNERIQLKDIKISHDLEAAASGVYEADEIQFEL